MEYVPFGAGTNIVLMLKNTLIKIGRFGIFVVSSRYFFVLIGLILYQKNAPNFQSKSHNFRDLLVLVVVLVKYQHLLCLIASI